MNRKKRYGRRIVLLSLLMFSVGCSNELPENAEQQNIPILFSSSALTVENRTESKASLEFINTDNSAFGVSSYLESYGIVSVGDMVNQQVFYDAPRNRYTYAPIVPWPANSAEKLGFLAYYPYADGSLENGISVTSGPASDPSLAFDIRVNTDPSRQVDLLVGYSEFRVMHTPVHLNFIHALCNITFSGVSSTFYGNNTVKVTGIKMYNVNTRGTSTYRAGMAPNWLLSTDPEDIKTIDMHTGNGIIDQFLGNTYARTLHSTTPTSGAGVVCLPQSVEDIVLEIRYTVLGFPDEIVKIIPLKGTGVTWQTGRSYTYQLRFTHESVVLTTEIEPWTDITQSTSIDGQYYLKTTESELAFDAAGQTLGLTVETNYDGSYIGLPAGIFVDGADIVYTPSVAAGEEWLSLEFTGTETGAVYTGRLHVTALPNGTGTVRTAKIRVKAGNMTYTVNVTQDF